MDLNKKISPQAVLALKEALSVIFWKKEDLQQFVKITLQNHPILATINWTATKRESIGELIERMTNRLDLFNDHLLTLLVAVTDFDDFSNLKFWDEDGSKTQKAKAAVNSLRTHTVGYIQQKVNEQEAGKRKQEAEKKIKLRLTLQEDLNALRERFNAIALNKNVQQRGFELESFLYDLFLLYDLEPKGSFKNYGEQIDGAFTFHGTDYLLEAKWKAQVGRSDIASFCYKVETKFKAAVGLLVTIDGVTPEAISPDFKSIIIMDGSDLAAVLEGRISLTDLLFKKRRKASETGKIYLPIQEL